jgi:hypothetical protein
VSTNKRKLASLLCVLVSTDNPVAITSQDMSIIRVPYRSALHMPTNTDITTTIKLLSQQHRPSCHSSNFTSNESFGVKITAIIIMVKICPGKFERFHGLLQSYRSEVECRCHSYVTTPTHVASILKSTLQALRATHTQLKFDTSPGHQG